MPPTGGEVCSGNDVPPTPCSQNCAPTSAATPGTGYAKVVWPLAAARATSARNSVVGSIHTGCSTTGGSSGAPSRVEP